MQRVAPAPTISPIIYAIRILVIWLFLSWLRDNSHLAAKLNLFTISFGVPIGIKSLLAFDITIGVNPSSTILVTRIDKPFGI